MMMSYRIKDLQRVIHHLEATYCRTPGSVTLLAVSKGHTSQSIEQAHAAGLCNFGENYLQEALEKIHALSARPLCWHFIGAIQSNKTHDIAQNFMWVHGISRKKIAHLLNNARPESMPALNVCIQVNIDNEKTKSGIQPDEVMELAADILLLPRLTLRGLMVIPKPGQNDAQQYASFSRVTNLLHQLNAQLNITLDTLSMGMSDDIEPAIRAGSTMVRVGRAIFGERI